MLCPAHALSHHQSHAQLHALTRASKVIYRVCFVIRKLMPVQDKSGIILHCSYSMALHLHNKGSFWRLIETAALREAVIITRTLFGFISYTNSSNPFSPELLLTSKTEGGWLDVNCMVQACPKRLQQSPLSTCCMKLGNHVGADARSSEAHHAAANEEVQADTCRCHITTLIRGANL